MANKAIIIHKETSGTNSPTAILTTATTRKLTDIVENDNDPTTGNPIVVSLSGNQFVVSPGTYRFNFMTLVCGAAAASSINSFSSYLYDITAAGNLYSAPGTSVVLKSDSANATYNCLQEFRGSNIVVSVNKTIELRTITAHAGATVIGGQAAGITGQVEVYSIIEIEAIS